MCHRLAADLSPEPSAHSLPLPACPIYTRVDGTRMCHAEELTAQNCAAQGRLQHCVMMWEQTFLQVPLHFNVWMHMIAACLPIGCQPPSCSMQAKADARACAMPCAQRLLPGLWFPCMTMLHRAFRFWVDTCSDSIADACRIILAYRKTERTAQVKISHSCCQA